ncbi:MAG: hypothetical protein ACKVS8_14350 [Phycisphaerales bacterium]
MTTLNPAKPEYFDYPAVAAEAGILPDQLAVIERAAAADYPGDKMMFELRMLRTCNAIKAGSVAASVVVYECLAALANLNKAA